MPLLNDIKNAARVVGLAMRGGFHVQDHDGVPALADGRAARTIFLLGNVGSSFWPAFSTSPEFRDGEVHPLDRWTRRVTGHLAAALGAEPLYPFDGPPHWPFQRWAQRAEACIPRHSACSSIPTMAYGTPIARRWCLPRRSICRRVTGVRGHATPAPTSRVCRRVRWVRSPARTMMLARVRRTSPRRPAPTAWTSAAARGEPARLDRSTPTNSITHASTWTRSCGRYWPKSVGWVSAAFRA